MPEDRVRLSCWRRILAAISCCGCFAGAFASASSPDKLVPVGVDRVQVTGEIGRRLAATIGNNLLVCDLNQFLAPFQKKDQKGGYIGMGKMIDSAVRFAAHTQNEKAIVFKQRVVSELLKTQEPDGYIGICEPQHRVWPLWDAHEMSYIIYGLVSDYVYFKEKPSLDAACKLADYMIALFPTMPADWVIKNDVAFHVALTGCAEAFMALYKQTNDKRYFDFVLHDLALTAWIPWIVIGRRPLIEGHIYGFLSSCMAQGELYRLRPEDILLRQSRRAMDFFIFNDGMTIIGGAGQWECWTSDQDGRGALGETCATAYQLRLLDSMLRLEGNATYGDLMERTIYNALFGAQSPDGRRIRYYTPFEGPREYHPSDTYCCPGNYRRIVADLPSMICYRTREGVAVNLYTPSVTSLELDGGAPVVLRQETDYPSSGAIAIYVDPAKPARFTLSLRIPAWCLKASISVNGQLFKGRTLGGAFVDIRREWKTGDWVDLALPMEWRFLRGRQRQAGRIAVTRGPLVYCLNPAANPAIANWDGADLGRITILPQTIVGPEKDDSIRPGGTACRIQGFKPGYPTRNPDLILRLTEFPVPNGKAIYFRAQDLSAAVDDELFHPEGRK
ncbi:MAG: glycoside hydrolase family 127 protein [Candidatus Sumerlaeota bacterium]|nr:glycoside hydrolase family 127 protein [Candidatus Sumerlaeota bacterium]